MDAEIEQVMLLLIRAADNQLLDKLSESLLPRARFLSLAQGPWEFWDYQHAVEPLRAAIAKRDGDGAAAATPSVPDRDGGAPGRGTAGRRRDVLTTGAAS